MKKRAREKVCVLGAGLWGTSLAQYLADKHHPVSLWEFFPHLAEKLEYSRTHPALPGLRLSPLIKISSDLPSSVAGARIILFVIPCQHVRNCARRLKPCLEKRSLPIIASAIKGIESQDLKTMSEVIEEEIPFMRGRVLGLSGPSFAREVARGVPTRLALAGPKGPLLRKAGGILNGHPLHVQTILDRKGVELCGALKNVIAIGCGILDGLKAGDNTKAALITQGLAEMEMIVRSQGGKSSTVYSVAGIGDLIATGTSAQSRNRALGQKLGEGKTLDQAIKEIHTVVEGVDSCANAHRLCQTARLKAPLVESVWGVVKRNTPPTKVLEAIGFIET